MTNVSSPPARRLPAAAWPAAAGLLLLLWAIREGIEAAASRSTLLWLLGASLVLFAAALVLDRKAHKGTVSSASPGSWAPSGTGARPGHPTGGPAPAKPVLTLAAADATPPPAAATDPVKATPAVSAIDPVTTMPPVPAPAISKTTLPAPPPAMSALLRPAVSPPPVAASAPVMGMTLGDLLLGALIDDPEDAGRLLSAAVGRATRTHPPAKADTS